MEFWKKLSLVKKIAIIILGLFVIILIIPQNKEAQLRREQEKQQKKEVKNNSIQKEEEKPIKETRITVTRADLGDAFPLTVDKCEVYCEGDMLFCYADGTTYALNGTARQKQPAIDPIWAQNPDIPEAKKGISPLMEIARKTCK